MKPLHRGLPVVPWAPLASPRLQVSTAVATKECSREPLEIPVHKRHFLPPASGSSAARLSLPKGGSVHASCPAARGGACEEVDGSAEVRVWGLTRQGRTASQRGSRMARSWTARCVAPGVSLYASATIDDAAADVSSMPPTSPEASERDLMLKAPINADAPNVSAFAEREPEVLPLLENVSISAFTDEASSGFTQALVSQGDITEEVACANSASSASACSGYSSTVSGTAGQESGKPPFQDANNDSTVSRVTLVEPGLNEVMPQLGKAARTFSQALRQPTRVDSRCMPRIATTESESGNEKDFDHLEKGKQRCCFNQVAAVSEATAARAPSWYSSADSCHPVFQHQVQLQGTPSLHTEDSASHISSKTHDSEARQPLQHVPLGTIGLRQSCVQLRQQRPAEMQQHNRSPQLCIEHPPFAITLPPRPSLPDTASKEPQFHYQHLRDSDMLHHPINWQASSPEDAQQRNYSLVPANACETSARDPTQLAAVTLCAGGPLTSLPWWPHATWPICSSLGVPPAVLPPHALQQLQQGLQRHLLPDWSSALSVPNFYYQHDLTGTQRLDCYNAYDTSRSSNPAAWAEPAQDARGSYSPGGLWQPAPSASVKEGMQPCLHMGEAFNFGHGSIDTNGASSSDCEPPQWNCRMHPEQPYQSLLASSQAAAYWVQQAQQDTTQRHQTRQFEQFEVSDSAARCSARAALTTSPHTLEAEEDEAQTDWVDAAAQTRSRTAKSTSTGERTSSIYRRQLLQQLALRYDQQTRQAQDITSLTAHGKKEPYKPNEKEAGLTEDCSPTILQQPCTEEESSICGKCDSSVPARLGEDFLPKAYEGTPTCVAAPSDTSVSLIDAAKIKRSHTEEAFLNHNPQPDYDGINVTHAPKIEEFVNRCTNTSSAHQFVAATEAADLCFLQQQMQWITPPPEATAALAAARAAAASAAAAIAAEWQQHLEQHYLEDWMQQLSPAHQWWLLHLQQTDQFSRRSTPTYTKDWQEMDLDPNIAMCVALDAEARSTTASAALQVSQEPQQLLQTAGDEDKWATGFNDPLPWELQRCTLEQQSMLAAPPSWTVFSHAPVTPTPSITSGAEGSCLQHLSEISFQREQQTTRTVRGSSRQPLPALHHCARTDRSEQRRSGPRESMQQFRVNATCPLSTTFSTATATYDDRAMPFVPQHPRQQRHLQRIAQRSAEYLNVYGQAGRLQQATTGQAQRSAPNRLGRRWRQMYRGHPPEYCYKDILLSMKQDVSSPQRRLRYVPRCIEAATSCSCNECTLHALGVGGARCRGGDCISAAEFVCPSGVGETCRSRSLRRRNEDARRSALHCETKLAELDIRAPVRRPSRRGSAVQQRHFWLESNTKRFTTRSCCPPNTRGVVEKNARRRGGSQGSVPQVETSTAVELDSSFAVEGGHALHRKDELRGGELFLRKEALQSRPANRSGEEAVDGEGFRLQESLSRGCSKPKAASNLMALLGDKASTDSTNRVSATRPAVSCLCGENCVQGRAKRNTANTAASPPTSSRRSERRRAAGHTLPLWVNGGNCTACQASSKTGGSTGTFCCSRRGNGDENCSRSTGMGLCVEVYKREEEKQTNLPAEKRRTRSKSPVSSVREVPADEKCFTPTRMYTRERMVTPSTGAFLRDAGQAEINEVVAPPARRGRRCHKDTTRLLEGAKGRQSGARSKGGSPPVATSTTVATSSTCSAAPTCGDTSCRSNGCMNEKVALFVNPEASLNADLRADMLEARLTVEAGGGSTSSRDKKADGGACAGHTDKRCGNVVTLKARSWLAVAREAAAKPTVHRTSTKSTTQLVQQLLHQEAASQGPHRQKLGKGSGSLVQPDTAKASACSKTADPDVSLSNTHE